MFEECSGDELWELKSEIQGSPWKTIFVCKYFFVCRFAVDIEPGEWRVFSQWSGGQDTGQHDTTDQIQPCW